MNTTSEEDFNSKEEVVLFDFKETQSHSVSSMTNDKLSDELKNHLGLKLDSFEIYKIIVETRKFEIENFWKRTLFFWGTISLVFAGYFNITNLKDYSIFVAYIGLFYNLIFCLSLRGSKYWQEHWELIATSYENAMGFKLFKWDLADLLEKHNKETFALFRPFRFSVSKLSMVLSDITLLLWLGFIFKDIRKLYLENRLLFDFSQPISNSYVDWFTVLVVLFPIIATLSIIPIIKGPIKIKKDLKSKFKFKVRSKDEKVEPF